jgi:hypothetical protein
MEARWGQDIPPVFGHLTSSPHMSDSLHSSSPARSSNEALPPYSQLQSTSNTLYSSQADSYDWPSYPTQLSTPQYRTTSPTRHNSTLASSLISPSSTQNLNRERYYCDQSTCVDRHGQRSSFNRRAELNRHTQAIHNGVKLDCPWPRCERKGERGLARLDHLIEHRRGFHHEDTPKRDGTGSDTDNRITSNFHPTKISE